MGSKRNMLNQNLKELTKWNMSKFVRKNQIRQKDQ